MQNHLSNPTEPVFVAVYTRKSTSEGLDKAFTTLDAQRQACEFYAASQQHEGWEVLPDRYDDGGFSGGNLERPALQRLLEDAKLGRFKVCVVYKVDRLSRSIADFIRIVDIFNEHGVSFVSVTQHFNTATSMGRLTLNILLSFAQFERETIAERIKDKMGAARRQGKFVGGLPPFGYDVPPEGGRLIINEVEAEQVRAIFDIFLKEPSIFLTQQAIAARGWTTKQWKTKRGKIMGGLPMSKRYLIRLLENVAYIGKVAYGGEIYEGEHRAIVDDAVFQEVQKLLVAAKHQKPLQHRNRHQAPLKGLLYCQRSERPMVYSFTQKKSGKQYCYYVCSQSQRPGCSCPIKSLQAYEAEAAIAKQISTISQQPEVLTNMLASLKRQKRKEIKRLGDELDGLQQDQAKTDEVLSNLKKAMVDGPSTARYQQRMSQLSAHYLSLSQQIRVLETNLIQWRAKTYEPKVLTQAFADFQIRWPDANKQERAKLLNRFVTRINFENDEGWLSFEFKSEELYADYADTQGENHGGENDDLQT